jgi:hypothetical protein
MPKALHGASSMIKRLPYPKNLAAVPDTENKETIKNLLATSADITVSPSSELVAKDTGASEIE